MKNDGGLAFPRPTSIASNGEHAWDQEGMSLRDYFAGRAMQAMIHSSAWNECAQKIVSEQAYAFADALIAEREKE